MKRSGWVLMLALVGCSSNTPEPAVVEYSIESRQARPVQRPAPVERAQSVRQRLLAQYQQWRGVPYRLGGTNRQGIDCSAFTSISYRQQFGVELPRSTASQSQVGRKIGRSELQPGDLVFFKTGSKLRHVGIYYGNNQFLHASTSKGVVLSSLSNEYWSDRYWHARRVEL